MYVQWNVYEISNIIYIFNKYTNYSIYHFYYTHIYVYIISLDESNKWELNKMYT